ncbi:hypothetical protein Y032_0899g2941 [Ancylostoma ceylanicum]|uniref:Uncharacterized protein n=1 Tax=Ancylostoma ceylanicum TaxID=53326 RepID=A0A016W9V0_9BILA|nr:hypothetical protein Y032_0899g2941 [Ancylostoma ceylanicum]
MRLGLLFVGLLAQASLGAADYYEIEGHFSSVHYALVTSGPGNLHSNKQAVDLLSQKLSASLQADLSNFYVNNFEIHGIEAGVPTVVFHGFLTTTSSLPRQQIIDQITESGDVKLYYLAQIGGCLPGVQANLDTSRQSFILVVNLRSTMAYDLHLLIGQVPTWISDINSAAPNLLDNFIVTTYLQYKNTYYMKSEIFSTSAQLLEYLNGLVISAGDADQPTIAAINSAQS